MEQIERKVPYVEILAGRVTVAGVPVALSTRELQLVMALALRGRADADGLVEELWPDAGGDCANGALKVYVHRVRRRLGNDFIVREGTAYRLSREARVDATEILQRLACGCGAAMSSPAQLEGLLELARRLRRMEVPESSRWAWFSPHARRFVSIGREFAVAVARAAQADGEIGLAKSVLRDLISEDPCDEEARELMIRTHLRCGEQGAAAYEFRLYASTLRAQLGLTPSPSLHALLQTQLVS